MVIRSIGLLEPRETLKPKRITPTSMAALRAVLLTGIFVLFLARAAAQPPADWTVNPSDYEFSMTLIFTTSIDGWVGGDADVAALFDAEGACRGVETAGFYNSETGWYTGLMLVYANNSLQPGLNCQLFDVDSGQILVSPTAINFQSNASLGTLMAPVVLSAVGDPAVGCMDPTACNFLPTAAEDNGSCVYPGCTDSAACNFESSPACIDLETCVFAESGFDCLGNCLEDFDGDGVCDADEVGGCTDPNACNFDGNATDEDCSCSYANFPYDCDGNCYNDADGDGVCDGLEVSGCTDSEACEYDLAATDDDGSCTYCCFQTGATEVSDALGFGLAIEPFATTEIEGLTRTAWRVYVTTPDLNDRVLGALGGPEGATFLTTSTTFYQHPEGTALASDITPDLLNAHSDLVFDSWLTVGLAQAATAPNAADATLSGSSIWSTLFEFGEDIFLGNSMPGGWSVPGSAGNAVAGNDHRVLIAQLTTDGELSGSITTTILPAEASESSTLTLTFTPPECGCMDPEACNHDEQALYDDGSCAYALPWRDCEDACLTDADGDGVCDEEEIAGCLEPNAANYNPDATDAGPCDIPGCTYAAAINFSPEATTDDGSCAFNDLGVGPEDPCADLNLDNVVGTSDLLILLSQFGNDCTP